MDRKRVVLLRIHVLIAGLAFAASLAPVQAQVTAAISGKVSDPSGAGVGGATVTVKSLETGATRSVTTDEKGDYTALSLPLGAQEVRVEKTSFKAALRTGVNLTVGQDAVVNVSLEIGDAAQQVTVTGEPSVVNTTTSVVSGLVGENQVKDLPLNGRSFDNLITLNPGTVNYELKSAATSTSNGNTFSVDGRRPSDNLVLLNGIEYTGSSQLAITPGGVSGDLLGVDAVREFDVLTDTYSAEYGKRSGAQVIAVTQSGTNQLHGSLYEFLRNSALDAKNFFAQNTIPPFRQNQVGGALGTPLKKDKWFLFLNAEGFRQALTQSNVSVVPDTQVRTGLFPNAAGVYTPVAKLDPTMLGYFSYWPAQNGPELLVNGLPSGTAFSYNAPKQSINEYFSTIRTDYNISDRDTLSAMSTLDTGNSLIPGADPLFAGATDLSMYVGSLQETHIFSPNILNTFRAGFSRAEYDLNSALLATFPANLDFVSGAASPGGIVVNGGVTTTGLSGITSAGPNNASNVWNRRNLFTYTDGLQISKGRHQISVGAWFQRVQDNEDTASRQFGQGTFASLTTFMQGTASTFQVVPSANELGFRSWFGALYVDDTIKVLPNLTVELGLRDEFTTGWNEESGRGSNYIAAPRAPSWRPRPSSVIRYSPRTTPSTCGRPEFRLRGTRTRTEKPSSAPASELIIR